MFMGDIFFECLLRDVLLLVSTTLPDDIKNSLVTSGTSEYKDYLT